MLQDHIVDIQCNIMEYYLIDCKENGGVNFIMRKRDLIKKLKNYEINPGDEELIKNMAKDYENKSEDEIFVEIIQLNARMEDELSYEEYENIFEKLESIRHLLSDEQNEKLNIILDAIDRK